MPTPPPTPVHSQGPSLPYTRQQAIDLYFIEHRGQLLDLASFLDRLDRGGVVAAVAL